MNEFLDRLPSHLREFADPSLPRDKRLLAAKGALPIPPREMALVLFALSLDRDEEVRSEARRSIEAIPEGVMESMLSDPATPPEFLHYVARTTGNESYLERIIVNPSTSDLTLTHLAAELDNPLLLDIIASNQERLVRCEAIVDALGRNPSVGRATMERVLGFLRLYFVKSDSRLAEYAGVEVEEKEAEEAPPAEEGEADSGPVLEEETARRLLEERQEDEELGEEQRENLYHLVKKMTVVEKIKLAMFGNKEVRAILAREPVKMIVSAVLKNPKILESEVVAMAQSVAVDQDILRQIAMERKWMKSYAVKLALASNPKTPTHISINLLKHLYPRDLQTLGASKNVPAVVAAAARRLLAEKRRR